MPRTCLACSHAERLAIDKALATGEPLRNIAKRVSISPAGLLRHKSHVAGTLAKAQERREEKLGDSIFDEIRLLQSKALELLGKMESEGDYRVQSWPRAKCESAWYHSMGSDQGGRRLGGHHRQHSDLWRARVRMNEKTGRGRWGSNCQRN